MPNINKAVDKSWETKSFKEILKAPPSALQGLTPEHDKIFAQLNIKTVGDLAESKYFAWAQAINALAKVEQ